jgi:signal transduction histidine kinase
MKNKSLKSIHQICNNLSFLSIFIAIIFASIISIILFINTSSKSIELERQRLHDILPLITRPIQANFIIGDDNSLQLLTKDLIQKYRLNNLYISDKPAPCANQLIFKYLPLSNNTHLCLSYLVPDKETKIYITIESSILHYDFSKLFYLLLLINFPLILLGLIVSAIIKNKFNKSIVKPIKLLASQPEQFSSENSSELALEVQELHNKLTLFMHEREEQKIKDSLIKITTQVAHDIRSPLAALDVATNIDFIPEDKRLLIRNATNRIRDIANNLLSQYSQKEIFNKPIIEAAQSEIVIDLVSNVISEKRLQYHCLPIEINFDFSKISYCTFIRVTASELKRIISNIIDNSIEAINSVGRIQIEITTSENEVTLALADNGKGMLQSQIDEILKGKNISTKKTGLGLGLSYCIDKIQNEWHGKIQIESAPNHGTTVKITLPKSSSPKWLADNIVIHPDQSIIILDDDKSIHESWKMRFNNEAIIHFYNSDDFLNWYQFQRSENDKYIFLFDYELLKDPFTGLELFEKLNIASDCYLVTSYHENLSIQEKCLNNSLKIIPKSFVPYIPITYFAKTKPVIVFIDDNESLRTAWSLAAAEANLEIHTFSSIKDFQPLQYSFHSSTTIYIDSELQDEIAGEVYARKLYDQGFKQIYLTTGYPPEKFQHLTWLKGVIGKYPNFI